MSGISIRRQDSSTPESKQLQRLPLIEPQSQELPSRPPGHLTNSNHIIERSARAVKPLRPSESEIDSTVNPQTQCAAPHSFRLLALPVELRRQILHLVLPYSCTYAQYGSVWHFGDTSLLRTCRQLHEEGASVLYASNTFIIKLERRDWIAVPPAKWLSHLAERRGLPMRFNKHCFDGSVIVRDFQEPFPMRPTDIWLIRRWDVRIAGMKRHKSAGSHDDFKIALMLQDRMQDLVDRILQGRQDLKFLRVKWHGDYATTASLKPHDKTILKPLQDVGIAFEEGYFLWGYTLLEQGVEAKEYELSSAS